jgi:hypothetical protein
MGVMEQVMRLCNFLPAILTELEIRKISAESVSKLKTCLNANQGYASDLVVQLLAAYDGGFHFFRQLFWKDRLSCRHLCGFI